MPENRKPIYFALILLFIGLGCYVATAQQVVPMRFNVPDTTKRQRIKISEPVCAASKNEFINSVFSNPERPPEYPGGIEKFYDFVQQHINYRNVTGRGRVIVTFVVEKDGSLNDVKALKGPTASAINEAVRAVTLSPKWKPGTQNGQTERMQYVVPIIFK